MAALGLERYIYFRLSDLSGTPVTGRAPSSFAVIFTRDNLAAPDTLSIAEIGAGRYFASYTPTTAGTDYVEIYDAPTDSRTEDVEVVEASSAVALLTQDYPAAGSLTVTQVGSPAAYTLYVFLASDWAAGRQAFSYAKGSSGLNADGTWTDSVYVPGGTYTVMITDGFTVVVIAPHLSVTA